MRILHVISPAPLPPLRWGGLSRSDEFATPDAAMALLAALVRHPTGLEHSTLVLGNAQSVERARSLGVRVDAACAPPLGIPSFALGTLRRTLNAINPAATFEWEGGRVNASPLESLHSSPTFHINTLSGELRNMQHARVIARLTPPMVPFACVMTQDEVTCRRNHAVALREEAGVGPRTRLIALLGDHPHVACVTTFATVLAMLHVAGIDVVGIFSPGAHQSDRAIRAVSGSGYTPRMIEAEGSVSEWLSACDGAVLCPPGEHLASASEDVAFAMHLEIAMARGAMLPVVAPSRPEFAALTRATADAPAAPISFAEQGRAAVIAGRLRDALVADRATPQQGTGAIAQAPAASNALLRSAGIALHKAIATIPYLHEPPAIESALFAGFRGAPASTGSPDARSSSSGV